MRNFGVMNIHIFGAARRISIIKIDFTKEIRRAEPNI